MHDARSEARYIPRWRRLGRGHTRRSGHRARAAPHPYNAKRMLKESVDGALRVLLIGGSDEQRARCLRAIVDAVPYVQIDVQPSLAGAWTLDEGVEAEYRALLEQSPVPIFVVTDGGVEYANPAASAVLGLAPADVPGRSLAEFVHPEDRAFVAERITRVLESGERLDSVEHRVLSAGGEIRWIDAAGVPITFRGKGLSR